MTHRLDCHLMSDAQHEKSTVSSDKDAAMELAEEICLLHVIPGGINRELISQLIREHAATMVAAALDIAGTCAENYKVLDIDSFTQQYGVNQLGEAIRTLNLRTELDRRSLTRSQTALAARSERALAERCHHNWLNSSIKCQSNAGHGGLHHFKSKSYEIFWEYRADYEEDAAKR